MFIFGASLGTATAWPRIGPQRYYANGDGRFYCRTQECTHGDVITFATREQAEAARLLPCPVCFPSERQRQQVAGHNGHGGDNQTR